jgi:Fanconi anemia group M protein
MQKHAVSGLGYEIALQGAKPKDRFPQAQLLVESLPGIGPGAAKRLLAHFGSAGAVLSATPEELKKVQGMGPKTIASIREVIEFDTRPHLAKIGEL